MPLFQTTYICPGRGKLNTTLYARDITHAKETARLRRMGEEVQYSIYGTCQCSECLKGNHAEEVPLSYHELPSYILRTHGVAGLGHAMHALVWITMIELRRRPERAWELMCDTGVVHELAHWVHAGRFSGGFEYNPERLIQRIEDFERSVPGVHPSWAEPQMASTADPGRDYVAPDYAEMRLYKSRLTTTEKFRP